MDYSDKMIIEEKEDDNKNYSFIPMTKSERSDSIRLSFIISMAARNQKKQLRESIMSKASNEEYK